MKFSTTLLALCFTAAATALPKRSTVTERMETRLARMEEQSERMGKRSERYQIPRIPHTYNPIGNVSSLPHPRPASNSTSTLKNLPGTAGSSSMSSAAQTNTTNWAGLYITAPSSRSFYRVSGTFQVPTPKPPVSGVAGTWWGAAWVGIDLGSGDPNGLLQTGVDWAVEVDSEGNTYYGYWGWYEWFPAGWIDYPDDLEILGGDVIKLAVQASSTSSGTAYLYDVTGDQAYNETLEAANTSSYLQLKTADWMVEDFADGGTVAFADFGTVEFTDCLALSTTVGLIGTLTSVLTSTISSLITSSTATIANLLNSAGSSVVTSTTNTASIVTITYI